MPKTSSAPCIVKLFCPTLHPWYIIRKRPMSQSASSLLPPLSNQDWPDALTDMQDGFSGQLNVYRVMAHHPALVRAWADLRQHIVIDTSLGRQMSEVVILRAATHLKSSYEWDSHVVRARTLGLTDARISSLKGDAANMEPNDAILVRAVDDLTQNARIQPETLSALIALVGHQGTLDLIATLGFYSTLGFILNTFNVPLDAEIAAELTASPLTP